MKSIAKWATRHPWPARLILAILHCLVAGIACCIGMTLVSADITLHPMLSTFFVILFLVLILRYPSRKRIPFALRYLYGRAKMMDFALLITSFCMIASFTNQEFAPKYPASQVELMIAPAMQHSSGKELRTQHKEQRKEIRMKVREILKEMKGDISGVEMIILSVVLVGFLAFALYGILALSCSLSCSGAEGLAVVVGFGGTGLIVYLSILGFRWIWTKDKIKAEPNS